MNVKEALKAKGKRLRNLLDKNQASVSNSLSGSDCSEDDNENEEGSSGSYELDSEEYLLLLGEDDDQPANSHFRVQLFTKRDSMVATRQADREINLLSTEAQAHEEICERMPSGDGGLVWHAHVIPDNFFVDGTLQRGLYSKDFDHDKQSIKSCRATLPVTVTDFFSSLTRIEGNEGPRWIFTGVLNDWPALQCLELLSLSRRRKRTSFATPKDFIQGTVRWTHHWSLDKQGRHGEDPSIPEGETRMFQATLQAAPWTELGWSPDSPGFAFWYEAMHPGEPRLSFGTDMVNTVGNDTCTFVHMISHRYAVKRETPKDRLTYHSLVLLEWEHGEYCTIIENALLNGVGGYKGKANWYHDKSEPVTQLFRTLPPQMIAPWIVNRSEIRCYDIDVKNLEEFKSFIHQYEGKQARFLDPHYTFSHQARLSYRSKSHIAQYLLNYVGRDCSYHELKHNCQTLAADLCSFLAGKKGVEPFHPVNRIEYRNRNYFFMYDSEMYQKKKSP